MAEGMEIFAIFFLSVLLYFLALKNFKLVYTSKHQLIIVVNRYFF